MLRKRNWLIVLIAGWAVALALAIGLAYFLFSGVDRVVERNTRGATTANQSKPSP